MLAKRPYKTSPYDDMKRINAPWLEDMTKMVKARITEFDAEYNGVPGLSNESTLYKRYLDNKALGLVFSNLEVFKYFVLMFRIKMYYELIGEWKFTEHDIEMYHYYSNDFNIVRSGKRIQTILTYEQGENVVNLNNITNSKLMSFSSEFNADVIYDYTFKYMFEGLGPFVVGYLALFTRKCYQFNMMIKRVKGCGSAKNETKYRQNMLHPDDYFSKPHLVAPQSTGYCEYELFSDIGIFTEDFKHEQLKNYINQNRSKYNAQAKERRTKNKETIAVKRAEYRKQNRLLINERRKQYRDTHKELIKEQKRRSYYANIDHIRSKSKNYYEANKEVLAAKNKIYREEHKEEIAQKNKVWRDTHHDELIAKGRSRWKTNRAYYIKKQHETYDKMVADGYRYRKDPVDGKRKWIYVGNET